MIWTLRSRRWRSRRNQSIKPVDSDCLSHPESKQLRVDMIEDELMVDD